MAISCWEQSLDFRVLNRFARSVEATANHFLIMIRPENELSKLQFQICLTRHWEKQFFSSFLDSASTGDVRIGIFQILEYDLITQRHFYCFFFRHSFSSYAMRGRRIRKAFWRSTLNFSRHNETRMVERAWVEVPNDHSLTKKNSSNIYALEIS